MRRSPALIACLCCHLLALAAVAAPRGPWGVQPLDPPPALLLQDTACRLGNTAVEVAYSGWWEGNETYAFLVDPADQGCGCNLGVALQTVHLVLGLDPGDRPTVQVKLLAAVPDGAGCLRPGSVLGYSVAMPLPEVSVPGYHDVALPVNFTCAETLSPYFVAVEFLDAAADGIDLVGGGDGTPCRTWNDWGFGWYDLVTDIGFPRDLSLWADFECCSAPVNTARRTWSEIKSGYLGD